MKVSFVAQERHGGRGHEARRGLQPREHGTGGARRRRRGPSPRDAAHLRDGSRPQHHKCGQQQRYRRFVAARTMSNGAVDMTM